ncbi:MAG TPA: hypothetical protein VIL26_03735 [Clostridia bacterium]
MTLFELLNNEKRVFDLPRKRVEIRSISLSHIVYFDSYWIEDVTYYLLKKQVVKINYLDDDDVIQIFVK